MRSPYRLSLKLFSLLLAFLLCQVSSRGEEGITIRSNGSQTTESIPDTMLLPDNPSAEFLRFSNLGALHTECVAVSPDGKLLAIGCQHAGGTLQVRLWNLRTGEEIKRFGLPVEGNGSTVEVDFSADGKLLASTHTHAYTKPTTCLWDVNTGELLLELPYGGHIDFSPTGPVLAVADINTYQSHLLRIVDGRTGKLIASLDLKKQGPLASQEFCYFRSLRFSQDGRKVHFCYSSISGTWTPATRQLQIHSDHSGKAALNINVLEPRHIVVDERNHLVALNDNGFSPVVLVDQQSGREVRRFTKKTYCARGLGFCENGSQLWYCSDDHVVVADIREGNELRKIPVGNDHQVILHPSERLLIMPVKTYGVCFRDFKTGQKVAQFTPVLAQRCWFSRIPNTGDWYGSEEVSQVFPDQINKSRGRSGVVPVLTHYLREETRQAHQEISQWSLVENGKSLELTPSSAKPVETIRWITETQKVHVSQATQIEGKSSRFELPPGLERSERFRAIATLPDGTFTGTSWTRSTSGSLQKDPQFRRLYVLAIGISEHKFKEYNLDYAARDAEQLTAFLQAQRGAVFDDVQIAGCLLNENATIEQLRKSLSVLQSQPGPNDTLLVFFAGHGIKGHRGLYLFMQNGDQDAISTTCLNWSELAESLHDSQAGQILLLADCCHAGAFSKEHYLNQKQLAESFQSDPRIHVLMAGSGEEFSIEDRTSQHGLFTSALLEALSGKADGNSDSAISLNEASRYVTDLVSRKSQNRQHPQTGWDESARGEEILTILP
ncbi:MAG: caspase family protein [Planctomycetaceae bacterium]|nr:caspase family protein [Planctomycetaceae bacterium]